jgi:hypothetical protein
VLDIGQVADLLIAIQQQDHSTEASIRALRGATVDELMTLAIELARRTTEADDEGEVWQARQ